MKIKPWWLIPMFSVFLLALAWSDYSERATKLVASQRKVAHCLQLSDRLSQLRSVLKDSLRPTAQSEIPADLKPVFSKYSFSTNGLKDSAEDMDGQYVKRIIETPAGTKVSMINVISLLNQLDAHPTRVFTDSVRLKNLSEIPLRAGQTERWGIETDWYYFQEKK